MNQCLPAGAGQSLNTPGLDTCIGAVAYGVATTPGGTNKVMAHASTPQVGTVIGRNFVQQVRASGMRIQGVCLSLPDPTRNDSLSDAEVGRMLRSMGRPVTAEAIRSLKAGFKAQLQAANESAKTSCMNGLGVNIQSYTRKNADVNKPAPYGTMTATAGPSGTVNADGKLMAKIR